MDGRQDDSEPGLPNIQVNLLNTSLAIVDSCYTDADGMYAFIDKPSGDYYIEFILPDNYQFSQQGQGYDHLDSDPDPTTGRTSLFNLTPYSHKNCDAGMFPIPVPTLSPQIAIFLMFLLSIVISFGLRKRSQQ